MQERYTVWVRNTFTGQKEEVEVSRGVYDVYRRSAWNIRDRERRFYAHETPCCALKGAGIGDDLLSVLAERARDRSGEERINRYRKILYACLGKLEREERELIFAVYYERRRITDLAREKEISRQWMQEKKRRVLDKMRAWAREMLEDGSGV